jgi:hypothetical protein
MAITIGTQDEVWSSEVLPCRRSSLFLGCHALLASVIVRISRVLESFVIVTLPTLTIAKLTSGITLPLAYPRDTTRSLRRYRGHISGGNAFHEANGGAVPGPVFSRTACSLYVLLGPSISSLQSRARQYLLWASPADDKIISFCAFFLYVRVLAMEQWTAESHMQHLEDAIKSSSGQTHRRRKSS